MSSNDKWAVKFPRKRRRAPDRVLPGESSERLRRRIAADVLQREPRPACSPAQLAEGDGLKESTRFAMRAVPTAADDQRLACRLALGRTMPAWSLLANTRLFQFDYDDSVSKPSGEFQPKRGLQATHNGVPVHIKYFQ